MKNNQEYFEILFHPYKYCEIFLDFIVQNIESCIEEISTPYFLSTHNEIIKSFNLSSFFSPNEQKYTQYIIRTLKNPKEILDSLSSFANLLSKRLEEEIDFGFGYRICQNKDWIEAYKQSIMPVSVGGFYIRPSWHPKSENNSLKDMVIDPALAFGSGHHATTSMCLEFLSTMDLKDKRLLDVGCGSGILSLGARMLGANVELCDTDPLSIEESHKNFALNASDFSSSWVGSIAQAKGEYDVIVANILAHIIMMLHSDFKTHLKSQGVLILSGILNDYKEQVLQKFSDFQIIKILEKDEWVALKLAKL